MPLALLAAASIALAKPIDCDIGRTCVIQQYVDHDPGPGAKDYRCLGATYDGHDGTDFRLPDKAAQMRGVFVLAAAAGVVKAVRDGEADFAVGAFDRAKVKGKECGNGVLIDHGDGWQTQYCHMRQGSVAVHPGDRVASGGKLGLVGQSGDAAFVHLHLTVRHDGRAVDPFSPDAQTCGMSAAGDTLWIAGAQPDMAYRGTQVLNAGFAGQTVTMDDIEGGQVRAPRPGAQLVAYVRVIDLRQGDRQTLTLRTENGTVLATSAPSPADHDKAQSFMFVGKSSTAPGNYTARYTVERDGAVVLSRDWQVRY